MSFKIKKITSTFRISKIRVKLQLSYSLAFVLLAVSIGGVFFIYTQRSQAYYAFKEKANQLLILQPKVITAEQNFITQESKNLIRFLEKGESVYLDNYQENLLKFKNTLKGLYNHQLTEKLQIKKNIILLRELTDMHDKTFSKLTEQVHYRGYQEGKMYTIIKKLQKVDSLDKISLLKLRKYEKDLIRQKNIRYLDSLRVEARTMLRIIGDSIQSRYPGDSASFANLGRITSVTSRYVSQMEKIVRSDYEIGVNNKIGLRGELSKNTQHIERELSTIHSQIEENIQILTASSNSVITVFFIVALIVAIVYAILFPVLFTQPILTIDRIAQSVTKGLRNQEVFLDKVKNKDEIGSIAQNLKVIITNFKQTMRQLQDKGDRLEAFVEEETKRRWHSEGLTIFNEIFRSNFVTSEKQLFEIVAELVKYTKSNQGGLFVVNDTHLEDVFLELRGCYAYERKKYQKKRVDIGEGLVGTSWRDDKTILITDIPQDYVHITSGLGKSTPNCLLIVPVKSDEQVEGVIELISFRFFKEYEIKFIEALTQRIASVLISIKAAEKTQELLRVSEKIAQEAQEKEAHLQKRLSDSRYWVQQFETKLNHVSEEAIVYQSIIGKVYAGLITTDEKFKITKVNNYVTKRFNYQRSDLIGETLDVLIETNYSNILDLKDKRFRLNTQTFNQNMLGKIVDRNGKAYNIETMSGKLELADKIIYVFLFNELEEEKKSDNSETTKKVVKKLKVAS